MATSKASRASFSSSPAALLAVPYSVTPGESHNFDLITSTQIIPTSSTNDPAYLFNQLKSAEWLQRYGLKSQKLTFDQILQNIGFKRVEGFDPVIGKTIAAKYAGKLYNEVQQDNGDRYCLTCRPEKLREYLHRLDRMLNLLRKRLLFITNGSRRLFGIIAEPSVCLVCDCKTFDHRLFNQFQSALTSLMKEQISKIKKFNIIWVSNDNEQFQEEPIDVNPSNIDRALDWIDDRKCPRDKISLSATCEAVMKAFNNKVHSIYLISEGDSSDFAREVLRDNVVKTRLSSNTPIPLNVVSLFCHNNDTQTFLRSITQSTDGSYFCYKIKDELPDMKAPPNLNDPTRIKLQDDKLQFGTNASAPASEYPIDIALMYKEIIQCQSVSDRINKILGFVDDEKQNSLQALAAIKSANVSDETNHPQRSLVVQPSTLFHSDENDMKSIDWLKVYGIDPQKLDFFSVLQSAAFRHCDGVVRVLKPPGDSEEVTDSTPANPQDKLINAIYCDQFAHVAWPDGTIRHVHVTPELHRDYERRIRAVLEKIKARLRWLKKGSREVFGSIVENNIYVLIDTSKSMQYHLDFVKEKLRLLIKDQLLAKERVNMVSFNSVVTPWRDRLTKLTDSIVQTQLQPWIDGLNTEGSTNALGALRFALADSTTEAIYLLTDGRPDQNERHILSQVQYRQVVPIHTIAFNCFDQTANQFLLDLAKQTSGRFHAFQYGLEKDKTIEQPESEDVSYLKQEFLRGENELARIAALRDQCLGQTWSKENLLPKVTKHKSRSNTNSAPIQLKTQSTIDVTFRPSSTTMPQRTTKKKRSATSQHRKFKSSSVTNISDIGSVLNINPNQWLLPETKDYLQGTDSKVNPPSDTEDTEKIEAPPIEIKKIKTPFDEVKSYLKKNSLVARSLTIFDVLQPTSVTVKEPRYIQVIDRYVLAKVWDDILPLTYGSYAGKLRLVNHYAVNLEDYEKQLQEQIIKYHQFTSKFIWKHLSDEDKRKLGPHLHWNRLSTDEQNAITQEISKEAYTSQSALESFAWRKLTDAEQNNLLEIPVLYQDGNQSLLKNALKDAEAESALKAVARMDVEIQRAIKFLQISTDLRQLQKRADMDSKAKPEEKPKPKIRPTSERSFGQRIICRFDPDGFFHPGIVQRSPDGRTIVQFDMGIEQEAIGHILLPTSGAIAQPHLFVNDYVLVRQRKNTDEFWAPAIVMVLPSPAARPPPLYMVRIFTPSPHQVHVHRRDILKISVNLFQQTLLYLRSRYHTLSPPDAEENGSSDDDTSPLPKDTIRKELEPLQRKVDNLYENHNERYDQLTKTLERQMVEIQRLHEKTPKTNFITNGSTQTVEISLKPNLPRLDSPKPKPKPRSPEPTTPLPRAETPPTRKRSKNFIEEGEHVYAVWADDDNLIYEGVVRKSINSNTYNVQRTDLPNISSDIALEDIFLERDLKCLKTLKRHSCILINNQEVFHDGSWVPAFRYGSWIPAIILNRDNETHVRLYDCNLGKLLNDAEVIPITEEQFERYTTARIDFERSLVNQVVVGLKETKKKRMFMVGTIIDRIESGHKYSIDWCDKTTSEQEEIHLFGAFRKRIEPVKGDFVLAIKQDEIIYEPAEVIAISTDRKTLTVRFLHSEETAREADVPSVTTFVITYEYYQSIINLLYH